MKVVSDIELKGTDLSLTNAIQQLAKSIETNQQLDVRPLISLAAQNNVFYDLLNQVSEAVILVSFSGEIRYHNATASLFLADEKTAQLLQQFLPKNEVGLVDLHATIELGKSIYLIQYSSVVWNGESVVCMHIGKEQSSKVLQLAETVAALSAFIHAEATPYLLLQDNQVIALNEGFKRSTKLKEETVLNLSLDAIIEVENTFKTLDGNKNQKRFSTHFKVGELLATLDCVKTDVVFHKHIFSLCNFLDPQALLGSDTLSAHRILEIASHDMREPVRTSISYLQLIQESFKKEKNEKLQSYNESALAELARLELLLSDMKAFISFDTKAIKHTKVSMKTIAEAVLKDLKKKIDSSDSMVNISGLPEVHADADSMKLLLTHLVDNALKFQQKDKRPYVEILAIKENQNIQFCVKDNGIGVDPRYHETIFEPFKRLNRADEFPGTGIGLSICKKIIAAHGGKIWIESKEGLGSNFFFTLPVS